MRKRRTVTRVEEREREVFILFRNPTAAEHGVPLLFNLGFPAMLLVLFAGRRARTALADMSGRAIACVTGYLRHRPEPWLEARVRRAFTEVDRDLAVILHEHWTVR